MDVVTLALAMKNGGSGVSEDVLTRIVGEQIAELVDNAPQSFDTLKEIADWIDIHQDEFMDLQSTINNMPNPPEIATVQETLTYLSSEFAISTPQSSGGASNGD